jgi:hypothetical protein
MRCRNVNNTNNTNNTNSTKNTNNNTNDVIGVMNRSNILTALHHMQADLKLLLPPGMYIYNIIHARRVHHLCICTASLEKVLFTHSPCIIH